MKTLLTLLLSLTLGYTALAQHSNSPAAYLNSIKNERAKVELKTINYYKASLTEQHHNMINARFEMVLDQLKRSRKDLAKKASFRNDERLKTQYLETFDSLYFIFNISFKHVEQIKLYSAQDQSGLEHYYQALAAAERNMMAAIKAFDRAENLFKTSYNTQIDRYQETNLKLDLLFKVSSYNRTITQCFKRVDIAMLNYLKIVDEVNSRSAETAALQEAFEILALALQTSKEEFAGLEKNKLNKSLVKDLRDFLSSTEKEVKKRLTEYNTAIQTKDYAAATFSETKLDFHYFNLDYTLMRKSFLKDRSDWLTTNLELMEAPELPEEIVILASL